MIDSAIIEIKAGKGGDGRVSFRKEKYVPKGGPDGGDGGNGGDILFCVDNQLSTLVNFSRLKKFYAQNGDPGGKNRCHGKDGDDLTLYVPKGTLIFEKKNDRWEKVIDLVDEQNEKIIAKGGRGGWGNVHFASPTYQTPRHANNGQSGESKELKLELKLIADVAIIGLPNAGKSTLLSAISNCKPKIGNYPFTTLEPNLGVVSHKGITFVAADIPGLIEGAYIGKGLGDKFLKHIERTRILIHLVSQEDDLEKSFQIINNELEKYQPKLAKKPQIVVINKIDIETNKVSQIVEFSNKYRAISISSAAKKNISELLNRVVEKL